MLKVGILYASTPRGIRLFLPKRMRPLFPHHTHDTATAGHLGISKTLHRLKSNVYWPKMTEDITHYMNSCEWCLSTKPVYMKPAAETNTLLGTHCNRLCRSTGEIKAWEQNLFSKWVQFIPLRETTAEATALALRDHIFTRYGVPKFLTADNAPTMTSHAIGKLLEEWGDQNIFITPYHSQANSTEKNTHNFTLVLHLKEMQKFIQPRIEQAKARQARNYNKGRREVPYLPGQLVLIREHPLSNTAKNFSAKLADRWSSPYKVIRSFNGVDLEVENESGVRKTVHVCNVKPYTTRRQDLRMEGGAAAHGVTEVSQES
ncbi:hypothetical protein B566_EDAN015225 [Ephemera danica]|nr:hypothetical protein B566_EDAN015225 [Ephemera danica]